MAVTPTGARHRLTALFAFLVAVAPERELPNLGLRQAWIFLEVQVDHRIEELLGNLDLPEGVQATTAGGLVSESAGRIPQPGEVVEGFGLRFEIVASTDRRVNRLRISRLPEAA